MTKPWYVKHPEMYAEVRVQVEDKYPELHLAIRSQGLYVCGYYPLYENGDVLDRYLVELKLPLDSPRGLPELYEVGGRIPSKPDRHMEGDRRACVVLPDAFWYAHPEGMTALEFLDGPVRSYLASQSLIEREQPGVWLDGEWGHGAEGVVEFYGPLLGTDDPDVILGFLRLLQGEAVKGHWRCPCGSGKRIRDCHFSLLVELRARIPRAVAANSVAALGDHQWRRT